MVYADVYAKLGWKGVIPNRNPHLFVTTETNPKAYSGKLTISKVIDAESPIIILGGQYVQRSYNDSFEAHTNCCLCQNGENVVKSPHIYNTSASER